MSVFQRYAIYYVPDDPRLAEFGARWLGWDIETGRAVERPVSAGAAEIVASPRKYGFHGTMKPPFRMASGRHIDDLAADLATFCSRTAPVSAGALHLARIGHFLALVPRGEIDALGDLAFSLVETFDPYRREASLAELERRRGAGLSAAQDANLVQWGYPYVGSEFRFHLTLTGKLDDRAITETETIVSSLIPDLGSVFDVTSVALVGEETTGQFRMIHRYALTG